MNLKNDSYTIYIGTQNSIEKYYRDEKGWVKISTKGKKFRMTADQLLNHLLPTLAGIKPGLLLKVKHVNNEAEK